MKRQMSNFPRLFIGAFHRQELVGVVIGSFDGRMKGWINRLAVSPKHRRKGIAHQLIKAVERALERRGVAIFCALIETPNEESLNVFKKMGYSTHREILYVSKRKSTDI